LIAKGFCCYPEISREVTLEAKKQGIDNYSLKPLLFSELLLEEKNNSNAQNEPHDVVFIDRYSMSCGVYVLLGTVTFL
jgi:predicted ATPase